MENTELKAKQILTYVQDRTKVDVSKKTRRREFVYARSLYFKLIREHTSMSFSEMGRNMKVDHATVIHSISNTFPTAFRYGKAIREAYRDFESCFTDNESDTLLYLRERLNDKENEVLKSYGYLP